MFIWLRNTSLKARVALLGVGSASITAIALVALAVWQSDQYNRLAQAEVDSLVEADLDHITLGIYHLVQAENEAVQQQVDHSLNFARLVLANAGGLDLGDESVSWNVVNQSTGASNRLQLPRMLIGGEWVGQNTDAAVGNPVVDEVTKLMGEYATIFQRINERGDMLRVATTVKDVAGRRAIGTYIPAVNPDGTPNSVIAAILKGETFRGRAFVVGSWHITAYEAVRNKSGSLIGMLYVGVQQARAEARIRNAVLQTTVGKSGYVYVLSGRGEDRGRYVISQKGERDGECIWDHKDSDGRLVIQEIVGKATLLKPGELATIRYCWKNPGDPVPRWKIARLAYYAPWDWVIGTSAYEDELQRYQAFLTEGRVRMTRTMGLAGLAIALLVGLVGVLVAINITRPLQQMKKAVNTIIQGNLDLALDIRSRDEIGALAQAFNAMTRKLGGTMEGLRRSEEKYRYIFENSTEGLFQTTIAGGFLNVSPAMARILGYDSAKDLMSSVTHVGRHLYVHPEERETLLAAALESKGVIEREVQLYRKDRRPIWVFLSLRAVRADPDQGLILQGFLTDITKRKRAEEALRELSKTQSVILENSTVGIALVRNRVFEWVNSRMPELFGISPEKFRGASTRIIYPDDAAYQRLGAEAYPVLAQGRRAALEIEMRKGDGSSFWCRLEGNALDAAKPHDGSIWIWEDITDRKRAEEELRKINKLHSVILDNSTVGIALVRNRVFEWVNPRMPELFGVSQEKFLGASTRIIYPDDAAYQRLGAEAYPLLAQGKKAAIELEMRKGDGSPFWCRLEGNALDPSKPHDGSIWIWEDITERKRTEEEKVKLQAQLMQAQKMESIGRLAGGVAHDFNNMLQAIIGNAVLALEMTPAEGPLRESLEEIERSAQRSADLTRQLLGFARKQTIQPKVLDLNDTVRGMLKMLRRLIGEDIELAWLPDSSLWPVKVDPTQIDQILANLCLNARDAIAGTGQVTIETANVTFDSTYARSHQECVPGDYVMLAVSDNGRGMDAATRAHLFEPFFTTKAPGKGTGLGLATVFGIVSQNQGLINVYSEPGQGTVFKIYLPRAAAPTAVSEQRTPCPSLRGTETVLLVEDDRQVLSLGRRILTQLGYTVLAAPTPSEAVALATHHADPIHLLITDVIMPGMNGKELHRRLLAIHPELKCLFMSGYTANVIAHRGVLDDGLRFLQKPFTNQHLAEKARETLDQPPKS